MEGVYNNIAHTYSPCPVFSLWCSHALASLHWMKRWREGEPGQGETPSDLDADQQQYHTHALHSAVQEWCVYGEGREGGRERKERERERERERESIIYVCVTVLSF